MILLDTHVVLWWRAGGERLSQNAARAIARSDGVLVSPISCWEIATLLRKGRIALDRDTYVWMRDLFAAEDVALAAITEQVAVTAGLLVDSFPGDPADRLIYATAQELDVPLVTKDESLIDFARSSRAVRTLWG